MNLGWKLAATIHEKAPEGLLDSYYTERYPIGMQVLDWSRAQVGIMQPDAASRALYTIVRDLMNTRDGATYFAGRVCGVDTHYNLGGNHPLTGRSVPNFELEDGTMLGELMGNGQGILLDFEANASLKALANEYGGQIKYIAGRAENKLGLSAALIRPDGFIAWASDANPNQGEFKMAANRWFVL
jgi:hypothetical protein